MNKNSYLILSLALISSCAHIKPKINHSNQFEEKTQTPTAIINNYKDSTQKRGLDKAVDTGVISTPNENFLKNNRSEKFEFWVNYFTTKDKRGFEKFAKNGERYREIIETTFQKYGLPKELYYVGLMESGYKNHAKSHAGAVGPWQFIKDTARRYGLKVTRSIDERRNIYKSTQAAALYFQDLYNIFGSWELALAAYNAGEYGIIRRIRGANTRKYYELSKRKIIPKETRHYVPKILAAMTVYENADHYGIHIEKPKNNFFLATKSININRSISISKLASKLKISSNTLKLLNHDIRGDYLPYMGRTGFELYIPDYKAISKNTIQNLSKFKKSVPKEILTKSKISKNTKNDNQTHTVRKNESLYSISKRYNIKIANLKRANNIKSNRIYVGQKILLPIKSHVQTKYSYIVKKGDNLTKIASIFKTRVKKLVNLNNLRRKNIYAGQRIKVPAHKKVTYIVKTGDNLSKIANINDTEIERIKSLNNLRSGLIVPGQKLLVKIKTI